MHPVYSVYLRLLPKLSALRWRLTIWTAVLLIFLGVSLIAFINTSLYISLPQAGTSLVLPTSVAALAFPSPDGVLSSPPDLTNLQVTATPLSSELAPYMDQTQVFAFQRVRTISLIGVIIFAITGALGSYYLVRILLHPLLLLDQQVNSIDANSLSYRLDSAGSPDELRSLARAFNRMLERLEQSFEQQGRFIADAAHELKTPLTTLRANLEVVQQDSNATVSDYQRMGEVFNQTLTRMETLVNDLLLLARGERGILLEPIYLQVILEEILEDLRPLAHRRQVNLQMQVDDEETILADNFLLSRALSNLIENGILYNHAGGVVTIKARAGIAAVVIFIEDTGIGIHPDEQPRIFDRFYRIEQSRSREGGSSGLGLAITAEVVRLHGGHLRVESTLGRGSRFTVWLPQSATVGQR